MYKQWMKAIILTITSLVTILPQVSVAAPKGFQSPSGNIFCELVYGISLRCEISSSLKPKPPQPYPGYCQFDWGQGFLLTAEGKPEILCISDTVADKNKPVLAYGRTWNNGGFKCVSQKTGLTCTNSNGIGFFLSREKWRVLGTHPTY
ncbi:hypothetical protein RI030_11620 [Aphanizomenon flos-aquae NRERC-008]|jgi:hypothetical protein|uniref:Uncharacterized protein n=1 Tax=Aphanizomenon flos-aquae FACHB-1249 TaxID=2692889 RepID=A0ABR8ITB4_APHFL|nr:MULTISPECIES: DUF6636 domain-containing protein [Aphanizomenon]MDJ0504737.1 hypothetical protein [Nostocales cyanobacterium LE14-WE12]MBD2391413.1 hypothetical protein [Aphanizomenon flos-aquae FACHB-1171]MBD2557763.1 hypothetical protein [Aphanizomenon flos-aquae FACHB-1290]MBD2632403.1 hypothetical protein [Aphanizomenon sp. FACHB-1399]MBD2643564.1 hypothetical protein [Aphanizomenon sp. FACHB-1401]